MKNKITLVQVLSTDTTQFEIVEKMNYNNGNNTMIVTDDIPQSRYIEKSKIFFETTSYYNKMVATHIFPSSNDLDIHDFYFANEFEKTISLLVEAFKNQRKMYQFAKAWNSYEHGDIDDDEIDEIGNKLAIVTKKMERKEAKTKIVNFSKYLDLSDFDIEELSSILSIDSAVLFSTQKIMIEK